MKKWKKQVSSVLAASVAATMCMTAVASAADKEEVVYVKADASGTVSEITVSDHLTNTLGLDTLTDISDLDDIFNVKGDETFVRDEDGTVTWDAGGNPIYYQGTSEKELPVAVKITYFLDEQEMEPEAMAGQSGHVRIRIDYENRTEENGVKVPFVAIGGMILSNDSFTNLEVTGGKILDDGKESVVVGIALPGLEQSLFPDGRSDEWKNLDFEIPEYIEVSMDTENFALAGTMHMISASLSDMLELDSMTSMDDLEDKITEITDASEQLTQGSADLLEGMNELKDKSGDFSDGIDQLNDGIKELEDGAASLQSGASALKDGGAALQSGTVTLSGGLNQLKSGASQLQKGVNELYSNSSKLDDGSGQIMNALDQINGALQSISFNTEQITALVEGSSAARQGIAQLAAGLQALEGSFADGGSIGSLKAKNTAAADQLDTLAGTVSGLQPLVTAAGALMKSYQGDDPAVKALIGQASSALGQIGSLSEVGAQCSQVAQLLRGNNQAYDQLKAGTAGLAAGAAELNEKYQQIDAAISQLPSLVNGILQQMGVLQQSIALLDEKYGDFDEGLTEYLEGYEQIVDGYKVLYKGISSAAGGAGQLVSGSGQLYSGLYELSSGADQLAGGVATLGEGGAQLGDGSSQLQEGVDQLQEGSRDLAEGMETFDSEAVQQIKDKVEGSLEDFMDQVKKVVEAAEGYSIFTQLAQGQTGKVTFLIETSAI